MVLYMWKVRIKRISLKRENESNGSYPGHFFEKHALLNICYEIRLEYVRTGMGKLCDII